jgi:putative (di)nucleoside polyphosphate hydrolase
MAEQPAQRPTQAEIERLPYRPCVGLMLLNRKGQVFVAQRVDVRGAAWQMPQGGIDPGESPRETALRELKEEIGTGSAEILGESQTWHRYDLPAHLIPKVWGGQYRGQTQKWFALLFTGADAEIDLEAHEPEFQAWCWADVDELPEMIVPFKRDVYDQVIQEFRPIVDRLRGEAGAD